MLETLRDIWSLLKSRKKFWLAPIIGVLLIMGLLIFFAGGSTLAPFIYTLF